MPPRSTRTQSFHPSYPYYAASRAESLRYTGVPPDMMQALALPLSDGETSIPPADKGKDAWLFLLAAFLVEAVVWGKMKIHLTYPHFTS